MYVVDGTIGSGKSTVLAELERRQAGWSIYPEPINEYTSFAGTNPLRDFYTAPNQYAFEFQAHVFQCVNDQLFTVMKDESEVRIIERGVPSCRYVFTQYLHDEGKLNEFQYRLLQRIFNNTAAPGAPYRVKKVFLLILKNAELALRRIENRGRSEEAGGKIALDYVEDLQSYIQSHYNNDSPRCHSNVYHIYTDDKSITEIADEVAIAHRLE